MINLERLNAIHLSPRPTGQRLMAWLALTPNYRWPFSPTKIEIEGAANIPKGGGSIFVMNHTDRYNYWPFQYQLWHQNLGYTATWVKGKYYESKAIGWFMDRMNNIPVPSKGYVLSKDFVLAMGRAPSDTEYLALKKLTDGQIDDGTAAAEGGEAVRAFLGWGWPETPGGRYADSLAHRFLEMMKRFLAINREALDMGLNLLVFPQGTRSVRLTRGHVGVAQVVLWAGAPVIPVGANGSDHCYPGNSPFSSGGHIVYRVGRPLTPELELKPFAIAEPFTPFTDTAEKHTPVFRALTDHLMDRVNELLDPPYRYADDVVLETGARRFL